MVIKSHAAAQRLLRDSRDVYQRGREIFLAGNATGNPERKSQAFSHFNQARRQRLDAMMAVAIMVGHVRVQSVLEISSLDQNGASFLVRPLSGSQFELRIPWEAVHETLPQEKLEPGSEG